MANDRNHIEKQPEFTPELRHLFSGTRIAWSKPKEEIWPDVLAKIELERTVKEHARTIVSLRYVAVVALIALLTGIPSIMYFYTKKIETLPTQQVVVTLPDNSRVKLLAQSVLDYKPLWWIFSRSVNMEGEGSFDVLKGKKFEVVSKKGTTVVLGTRFDVFARNSEYNVTCTSGKVKVIESAYHNAVIITGGQKAILKADGKFEIIGQTDNKVQDVEIKPASDQFIEKELDEVLKPVSEEIAPVQTQQSRIAPEKPVITKEQGSEDAKGNQNAREVITEQNRIQTQNVEPVLNEDKAKVSNQPAAGNTEQEVTPGSKQNSRDQNTPVKDKFRASLTPAQLSILENKQLSREEKQKAFMQSLSREQKQLLKEQNEERGRQVEAGKDAASGNGNMKDQEKMQMREQMRDGTDKGNMEQQRGQTREENARQGAGNGSDQGGGGNNRNQTGKGN